MIRINSESGFVRLESWEDVLSRPAFTSNLDPKSLKLIQAIGVYNFPTFEPCGLSNCHTMHGKGFLVVAEGGIETNIGRICGKRHFPDTFGALTRQLLQDVRAQENRETLTALKHRLPTLQAAVEELKSGFHGATWVHHRLLQLRGARAGLPASLTYDIGSLIRNRSNAITVQRKLTRQERAQGDQFNAKELGLTVGNRGSAQYVEEVKGYLEGMDAFAPANDLRVLLHDTIDPYLLALEQADVGNLRPRDLRELARQGATIDRHIAQAGIAIRAGRELLTRPNMSKLLDLLETTAERKQLDAFLFDLPEMPTISG